MKVTVKDLKVGDLIKASFLNDNQWHEVLAIKIQSNGVYLAVEGFKGEIFSADREVEKQG